MMKKMFQLDFCRHHCAPRTRRDPACRGARAHALKADALGSWRRGFCGFLLAAGLLAVGGAAVAGTGDWPGWGGPDPGRNMFAPATGLPDRFDPGKPKRGSYEIDLSTAKNIKWVAKLGKQTYGNPTVADGRIYVGTNNEAPRDPAVKGDRSILLCLDEKTGAFLWQLVVTKLKAGKVNDWEALGLLSSPMVEGKFVYVVTSRCEVLCLDVEGMANGNDGPYKDEANYKSLDTGNPPAEIGPKDADIIWRFDMMDELGVFPHNASNSSPLILGDLVYVCTSNGQDWSHVNIPAPLAPSFIGLDKRTGKLAGEDEAGIGPRIYHGQWTSLSTGQIAGKWQIYCGGGDGWLYALDATPTPGEGDLGMLKTVWKFDCNPPEYKVKDGKPIRYPNAAGPSEINSTPVFWKNRVYVATGQDPEHGEGVGHLVCLDATKTGDTTKAGPIWSYKGIRRTLATVSIDPQTGLLFAADFSGFVHCLDAETGKLHWVHDMKSHMWGSTLVADGKVFLGDQDGDFAILAASKEKKLLSEVNFPAPVYTTPIVANGVLYIATQEQLYAVHNEANPPGTKDEPPKVDVKLKP